MAGLSEQAVAEVRAGDKSEVLDAAGSAGFFLWRSTYVVKQVGLYMRFLTAFGACFVEPTCVCFIVSCVFSIYLCLVCTSCVLYLCNLYYLCILLCLVLLCTSVFISY